METVQVGVVRDSMLANPLLIRSELGRSRPRGFSLPGQDFVYGRINPNRDGGVPEAMSHWVTVVPTSLPGSSSRKMGKDFVALNREAVKSGLVTAQEHYQYRATHDIPRRSPAREGSRLQRPRAPPDVTFGISTRPSTPIFELLEHRYAQRWLEEQQSAERAKLPVCLRRASASNLVLTRGSDCRGPGAPPDNNPIISFINDVMKANSVKIACKQLDLGLLINSVSLLIKVRRGGGWGGCAVEFPPPRERVITQKSPSSQWEQIAGDARGRDTFKTELLSVTQVHFLGKVSPGSISSPMCVFNPFYLWLLAFSSLSSPPPRLPVTGAECLPSLRARPGRCDSYL